MPDRSKPKKVEKPEPRTITYLNYTEVESYIKSKYKKDVAKLWDWICWLKEPRDGMIFTLYEDYANPQNMKGKEDVAEIIKLIFDEFKDCSDKYGDISFKVYW